MTDATEGETLDVLLRIVERDCDDRRRALADEAESRANEIVREARRAARAEVKEAIAEVRRRARRRIEDARATLAVEARARRSAASRDLLELARATLPETLRAAWADSVARARWVDATMSAAARALPLGTWEVTHAPLDRDEVARVEARVREITGEAGDVREAKEIASGLCVRVGPSRLDGTEAGLLADGPLVEGRLLAEMLREIGDGGARE